MTTPVFYNEFMRLEAGRRLLNFLGVGGGVGRGVDMVVWESRRYVATLQAAWRVEQS